CSGGRGSCRAALAGGSAGASPSRMQTSASRRLPLLDLGGPVAQGLLQAIDRLVDLVSYLERVAAFFQLPELAIELLRPGQALLLQPLLVLRRQRGVFGQDQHRTALPQVGQP